MASRCAEKARPNGPGLAISFMEAVASGEKDIFVFGLKPPVTGPPSRHLTPICAL
jgi:hypothetical protein